MDSALLHTRTLCEFLGLEEGWAKGRSPHLAPRLPLWTAYQGAMHMKVLHPDPRRPYVAGVQKGDDLMDRVADLAHEVLTAWEQVAAQTEMTEFRSAMDRARSRAVDASQRAADRMQTDPLFS
jgi:hypothetical protein